MQYALPLHNRRFSFSPEDGVISVYVIRRICLFCMEPVALVQLPQPEGAHASCETASNGIIWANCFVLSASSHVEVESGFPFPTHSL